MQRWKLEEKIEEKRAACVEQKIVNVTGAYHQYKLEKLNSNGEKENGWEKAVPSFLCAKEIGEKEGKRYKRANVSRKIEQRVISIDIAAQKAPDVNIVNAVKGNKIDKILQIELAPAANLIVNRSRSSPKRWIQKRERKDQIEVKKKEEQEQVLHYAVASRAFAIENAAQIKEHTVDDQQ